MEEEKEMVKFKRLNEIDEEEPGDLLTIRITNALLKKKVGKNGEEIKTLEVTIEENSEVMTNSKEREEHRKKMKNQDNWFDKKLRQFKDPERKKPVTIADPNHPLEIITGDVSLLIRIEGKYYYLFICRDIDPEGWINPGGCPENIKELYNPLHVAKRECGEEACILEKKGKAYTAYSLCFSKEEWIKNHICWLLKKDIYPQEIIELELKRDKIFPERGDAQNLVIKRGSKEENVEDVNIFINTKKASVKIMLYWEVKLPVKMDELMMFDGEDENKINRPVGLFTEVEIKNEVHPPHPDVIFVSGQDILSVGFSNPKIKEQITAS